MTFFAFIFRKLHQLTKHNLIVACIWYSVPLLAILLKIIPFGTCNNYLIYKGVYSHTLQQCNLYNFYPAEYVDKNHYGILFSLVIAPFCYLPDWLGILIYQALQLLALYMLIRKLPFTQQKQNALLLFILVEAITNCQNCQTNTFIACLLIGAFIFIQTKKEALAAFAIVFGFLIKLYGIVGLGLFFFIKRKFRFMLFGFLSLLALYFLPLLITSYHFNNQSYIDWYIELKSKNNTNSDLSNVHQNMSLLGMFVKLTGNKAFNYLFVLLPAMILQCIPLMRVHYIKNDTFQIKYFATLLLFLILFNTATETSTYIIGAIGVGIWWLASEQPRSNGVLFLLLFVFIFGTLSTTDVMPNFVNYDIVRKYSLKAFPYFVIWMIGLYELVFKTYKQQILNG